MASSKLLTHSERSRGGLLAAISAMWLLVLSTMSTVSLVEGQLRYGFYSASCPNAENIARAALMANVARDPTAPAALLRLAFHDCIVEGCDASITLTAGPQVSSELISDRNFGIRRLDFIDNIKSALENACPGRVSCSDIIVMAARDAILLSSGPFIQVPLGRRDGTSASNRRADSSIPPASSGLATALADFSRMGMTLQESVAIIGAHTLGVGHCVSILHRLFPNQDPQLSTSLFGAQLRTSCPTSPPITNATVINNDFTNGLFDNQYYRDLTLGRGLFTIDSELSTDSRTAPIVSQFAGNIGLFYQTFSTAFVKLTSNRVLTGNQGQVRRSCRVVN